MYGPVDFYHKTLYDINKHIHELCKFIDFLYKNNVHKFYIEYKAYGLGDIIRYYDGSFEEIAIKKVDHPIFRHIRDHVKILPLDGIINGKTLNKLIVRGFLLEDELNTIFLDKDDYFIYEKYKKNELIKIMYTS